MKNIFIILNLVVSVVNAAEPLGCQAYKIPEDASCITLKGKTRYENNHVYLLENLSRGTLLLFDEKDDNHFELSGGNIGALGLTVPEGTWCCFEKTLSGERKSYCAVLLKICEYRSVRMPKTLAPIQWFGQYSTLSDLGILIRQQGVDLILDYSPKSTAKSSV